MTSLSRLKPTVPSGATQRACVAGYDARKQPTMAPPASPRAASHAAHSMRRASLDRMFSRTGSRRHSLEAVRWRAWLQLLLLLSVAVTAASSGRARPREAT